MEADSWRRAWSGVFLPDVFSESCPYDNGNGQADIQRCFGRAELEPLEARGFLTCVRDFLDGVSRVWRSSICARFSD